MKRIWIAAVIVGLVMAVGLAVNNAYSVPGDSVIPPEVYGFCFPAEITPELTVKWVKHVIISADDVEAQMGLRSDGVVVWKDYRTKEK